MASPSQLIQPLVSTDAMSTLTSVNGRTVAPRGNESADSLLSRADSLSRYRQVVQTSLPLIAADLIAIAGSYLLATLGTYALIGMHYYWGLWNNVFAMCVLYLTVGASLGLFPASGINPVRELRKQVSSIAVAFALLVAMNGLLGEVTLNEIITIVLAFPMMFVLAPPARFSIRKIVSGCSWWGEKVIIVGMGRQGVAVYQFLKQLPQRGLKPLGIVDGSPGEYWNSAYNNAQFDFLGTTDEIVSVCRKRQCHWVIAAVANKDEFEVQHILDRCSFVPNLVVLSSSHLTPSMWAESFDVAGLAGIHICDRLLFPIQRYTKRLTDIIVSVALLIICSPLIAAIFGLVKWKSPGPVLYRHRGRIGRGGILFGALKIRTMVANADEVLEDYLSSNPEARREWNANQKLQNDPRIIPGIGRILRRTSLDELPQLLNVIVGDMSLVGPRPIVSTEIEKYGDVFELYKRVRPGLTGLWQVTGRNNTSYADRVRLDAYYVRNWSLWLDYFLLLRTVRTVLLREGSC